jgi:acylphosphatase
MTESISQIGYLVRGRVQGVGFRWWTRTTAAELGIRGTVKNLSDGTVEVHAAGLGAELENLRCRLVSGPRSARVVSVEEIPSPDPLPPDFEVRF